MLQAAPSVCVAFGHTDALAGPFAPLSRGMWNWGCFHSQEAPLPFYSCLALLLLTHTWGWGVGLIGSMRLTCDLPSLESSVPPHL